MKNKIGEKISKLFEKIRDNKKIQIFLVCAVLLIVLLYYFLSTTKSNRTDAELENATSTTTEYVKYVESKLENTIKSIENVKTVNVNVSLETGFEYVYATKDETKTTSSGTLSSSELILVSGQPVLLKEIYPKIQGVVVVVNEVDVKTKLAILEAIQTVLEISNEKISIIS